jgi:hypothetical protein
VLVFDNIKLFLLIFILSFSFIFSTTFKDRLLKAQKGDFIVALQDNIYTLLLIHEVNKTSLIFSEASLPQNQKKLPWREWIEKNAPSNIGWTLYEIDLESNKIKKCFSLSRSCYLQITDNNFFTTLLNLPLSPLPDDKRKKIGPPSLEDFDHRAIWNPPMIVDGVSQKTNFCVFQTNWPKDGSSLSHKTIDLYFDKNGTFPFPFWIQINTGHLDIMLRIIDSGKNLFSLKTFPES